MKNLTSREFFKETFTELGADAVNIFKIPPDSEQLKHYYKNHPVRSKFTDFNQYDCQTKYNKKLLTVVSTTFGKKVGKRIKFHSFIGMDVEYPANGDTKALLFKILKKFNFKGYIFRTPNSYHLFIKKVFDDDLTLIKQISDIISFSSTLLEQTWVGEYCNEFRNAGNYIQLIETAEKILDEVGHLGEGRYTLFDLRHLAHAICSNERCREERNRKDFECDDGVRMQAFFCVTRREDRGLTPHLETVFEP